MAEKITIQTSSGSRTVPIAPPEHAFSALHNIQAGIELHKVVLARGLAKGQEERYREEIKIDTQAIADLMRLIPGLPAAEAKWLAEREQKEREINSRLGSDD